MAEFGRWAAYRRKRGSLHPGLRVDRAVGLLAALYVNSHKKKGSTPHKLWDFLPCEDEPPITMEQAMETWH